LDSGGESVLQKRKIISGSCLGEVWGSYLNLWCIKEWTKDSRRCLGGVSGGSRAPKEKNHLG